MNNFEERIEKYAKDIAEGERLQNFMKDANKIILNKKLDDAQKLESLKMMDIKLSDAKLAELLKPDFANRIGFPSYKLTNNGANIRRMKKETEGLQSKLKRETTEYMVKDVRIVENAGMDRIQLFFPDKPAEGVRNSLKRNGFKWAPSEGAWQAFLKTWNVMSAKRILENEYQGAEENEKGALPEIDKIDPEEFWREANGIADDVAELVELARSIPSGWDKV